MKKLLSGLVLAAFSLWASATTLNPVQLLNPAGSSSGQAIVSTGASTAPGWGNVPIANVTGGAPLASPSFTGTVSITNTSGNSLSVNGTGNTTSGAQFFLQGNGATTPNKYLRAFNGQLQCVNSANSVVICTLDDTGNLTLTGGITAGPASFTTLTANGVITGVPGRLLNVQVITASGTYTPTAGTNRAIVEGVGGGGAGGGAPATGAAQASIGGGGSAGAFGRIYIGSGLSSQTVTIGAGGTAGAAGASGNTGGTTSFGTLMSLPGGPGGATSGPTPGPAIAVSSSQSAAPSGSGTFLYSSKGMYATIGVIASATSIASGTGANSPYGAGGPNAASTGSGSTGSGFGSGGGGAGALASQSAQVGAVGQPGVIIVYEYQ